MEKYRILRPVGRGTFGAAMLVQSNSDGKQYVMKQIDVKDMSDKDRAGADNEVSVLRSLRHPNIISYRESFVHDGYLCIVMEYADGGDLAAVLKERKGKPVEEEVVWDWFTQVCLALKHMHDRHVMHRDVKCQNIFLTKSGVLKMGDFGISKRLNNTAELAKTAIGTPYYLSPEICRQKKYNYKSDIWSLGCVLYEMAAQKHAFQGNDMRQLVMRILKGSFPPLGRPYSRAMQEMVSELLNCDPKKRPSINAILSKPIIKSRVPRILAQIGAVSAPPEPLPVSIIPRLPDAIFEDDELDDDGDDGEEDGKLDVDDSVVDAVASEVIHAVESQTTHNDTPPNPTLQARRDVAKGIADRIQKLATEISAYKFPRAEQASIEAEVDRRIADAVPGKPKYLASNVQGTPPRSQQQQNSSKVQQSPASSKQTPSRSVSKRQQEQQASKPVDDVPVVPKSSSKPLTQQQSSSAIDESLDAEIVNYMRNSPDALSSTSVDDVIIVNAKAPRSHHHQHHRPSSGKRDVAASVKSDVREAGVRDKPVKQPQPQPQLVSNDKGTDVAAIARQKLAGKTAALRRRSIAEKAEKFNDNLKQLWSVVGIPIDKPTEPSGRRLSQASDDGHHDKPVPVNRTAIPTTTSKPDSRRRSGAPTFMPPQPIAPSQPQPQPSSRQGDGNVRKSFGGVTKQKSQRHTDDTNSDATAMSMQQFLKMRRSSQGGKDSDNGVANVHVTKPEPTITRSHSTVTTTVTPSTVATRPQPQAQPQPVSRMFHKLSGEVQIPSVSIRQSSQQQQQQSSSKKSTVSKEAPVPVNNNKQSQQQQQQPRVKSAGGNANSNETAVLKPRAVTKPPSEADEVAAAARKAAREKQQNEMRAMIQQQRAKLSASKDKSSDGDADIIVLVPKAPKPVVVPQQQQQSAAQVQSTPIISPVASTAQLIEHGRRAGLTKPMSLDTVTPDTTQPQLQSTPSLDSPRQSPDMMDPKRAAREKLREEMREAIRRDRLKHKRIDGDGVEVSNGKSSSSSSGPEFQVFAKPYPDKPIIPTQPVIPFPTSITPTARQQHSLQQSSPSHDLNLSLESEQSPGDIIPSFKSRVPVPSTSNSNAIDQYWSSQQPPSSTTQYQLQPYTSQGQHSRGHSSTNLFTLSGSVPHPPSEHSGTIFAGLMDDSLADTSLRTTYMTTVHNPSSRTVVPTANPGSSPLRSHRHTGSDGVDCICDDVRHQHQRRISEDSRYAWQSVQLRQSPLTDTQPQHIPRSSPITDSLTKPPSLQPYPTQQQPSHFTPSHMQQQHRMPTHHSPSHGSGYRASTTLTNVGAITIAGLPVTTAQSHADESLIDVMSQAIGQLPASASAHHKVEALRMYLESKLGLQSLVTAHRTIEKYGQTTSTAELDERLLSIMGDHNANLIPVVRQLVRAEHTLTK